MGPLSRRSDRSSRHSSSRPDKKARPQPASAPKVISKLVKPLVEYESNESSLSSNNSPVHYKEDKHSSYKSSSSRSSRVVKPTKSTIKSISRSKKQPNKHRSSASSKATS